MKPETIKEAFSILRMLKNRFELEIKDNPERTFPGKAYLDDIKKVLKEAGEE